MSARLSADSEGRTHKVDDELLGLEILLHLHPHAVSLQLANPLLLLQWFLVAENGLRSLLLRQLVPLQLLHFRTRRDRQILTCRQ